MSGHNKWSKIKHKKASEDAKKSKAFSMLARQIALESRAVGGDANSPRLRTLVEKARKVNMPGDNIDRAIAKGAGGGSDSYEAVLYEGYGPGGVAMIIEGISDNKNRTSAEIKHLFSERGFSLGNPGSVTWAFERSEEDSALVWKPTQFFPIEAAEKESLADFIEELEEHDDIKRVFTNAE